MFNHWKVSVKTDTAATVTACIKAPPITVVATNTGCNFAYTTVHNAGFSVKKWYSMEADETCRNISDMIVPASKLQHISHHTKQVGNIIDKVKVDLFIDTSLCQLWSQYNVSKASVPLVKGFLDTRA